MEPTDPLPAPVAAQPVVLSYGGSDLLPERPILPVGERIFHFLTAIALPITCFAISAGGYPAAVEWQSGQWFARLSLIPAPRVGWSFFPLLAIAMVAAGYMIFAPKRAITSLNVRAGLITGVLLAYQYSFLQVISIVKDPNPVGGVIVGLILPLAFIAGVPFARWTADVVVWRRPWYRGRGRKYLWIGVAVAGAAVIALARPLGAMRSLLGLPLLFALMFAPGLTLGTFSSLYLTARRRGGPLRPSATALLAWLLGWPVALAAAWAKSYLNAIDAYAKLPTAAPGCYVATAATRGHRRFVRRRVVDGRTLTPQLAVLKAGELAFAAAYPAGHRAVRRVYDAVGPTLARRVRNPVTADLVYVSLKPFEWAAALCLARLDRP